MARLIDETGGVLLATVTALVTNNRFTAELAAAIRKDGGVTRAFDALHREFFPEEDKPVAPAPEQIVTYTAQVHYGVTPSHAQLQKEFNWVWDGWKNTSFERLDVCKDIPFANEVKDVAFELVHLAQYMSTEAVLAELDRRGLRPATHEELLGFARKYPELQRQFPIVALGSITLIGGHRRVAYVRRSDDGRDLDLYVADDDWRDDDRFLAVRK